LVLSEQLS